jgi:hypothetical protein
MIDQLDAQFNGMLHNAEHVLNIINNVIDMCTLNNDDNMAMRLFKAAVLDMIRMELNDLQRPVKQ